MTLIEKLKEEEIQINAYTFKLTRESAERFTKIFDEFAVEFAEWVLNRALGESGLELKDDTLDKFKKEKGL